MFNLKITFTKKEIVGLILISILLGTAIYTNMLVSLRKSRDAQRRGDLRTLQSIMTAFQKKYGYYPDAHEGKLVACESGKFDALGNPVFQDCEWGWDKPVGIPLPADPYTSDGRRYRYESVRSHFQVYAALESESDPEYSLVVRHRGLICGNIICNFGLSDAETPVDIDLNKYLEILRAKEK